ncbi:MAG: hypothetical protein QW703_01360 [Candidatus Aenigmatarchaeota archaeon]
MIGQSIILEAVLLFGISVSIFLLCQSLFLSNEEYIRNQVETNQLEMVKNNIVAMIYTIANNPTDINISIDIPQRVGETTYVIILSGKNIKLESAKYKTETTLNINYDMSGQATSFLGKLELKKTENKIFIE